MCSFIIHKFYDYESLWKKTFLWSLDLVSDLIRVNESADPVIFQAFAPFGVIKTVDLNVDPLTGRHKGYAYVEYDLPESAQLAIEQVSKLMGLFSFTG